MSPEPSIESLLNPDPESAPVLPSGVFPGDVDSATLAALLGLTSARVSLLARSGALPRNNGRYPIPAAVVAYVDYIKANPAGRRISDPDLADQKKRLAKEQADKIALANAITRDELVPVEAVRREWQGIALDLRARLLAVGPRVAAATGLDRAAAAALDSELRSALEDIADDR